MDRGSFNVLNRDYDEFEGMVAHLSKKACQKAYEEARLFPTLLDLTMYPKLDIWPKSFERSEPSDDSIALYFFPMHKRCWLLYFVAMHSTLVFCILSFFIFYFFLSFLATDMKGRSITWLSR